MLKSLQILTSHLNGARKWQAIWLSALMITTGIVEVFSIGMLIPFLGVMFDPSRVISNEYVEKAFHLVGINSVAPQEIVLWVTVFFVFGILLSGAVRLALLAYQTRFSQLLGADISYEVYKKVLDQPYSYYLGTNSAEAVAAVFSKTTRVATHLLLPLLILGGATINFLCILAVLLVINWQVSIGTASVLALTYYGLVTLSKKYVRNSSVQISVGQNEILKNLKESLHGIRNLILDGSQSQALNRFKELDSQTRKAEEHIHIISVAPRYIIEAVGISVIAVIANMMVGSESAAAALIILATLGLGAQKLLPLTQLAYTSWSTAKGSESMLDDIVGYLEMPSRSQEAGESIHFEASIELRNVCFRYQQDMRDVLSNINLKISKGERIGIVGATGAGKSTLLDIFLGLLQPTTGVFMVDGVEVNASNARIWQSMLGHVPQSLYLGDKSIAENVATELQKELIAMNEIKDALELAELADTINRLPDGVWTSVGEHGIRLSGGQRQRIGLARAFYKKAGVIIIDEGTSALDIETERAISETLQRLPEDVTIITVAHRSAALKGCSRILRLEDGALKEIEPTEVV